MAVDAFIQFVKQGTMMDVKGETKDEFYSKKEPPFFEIKDFSFGVENPTTIGSSTGGAGAGKIKFNEFTIKKTSDSASPAFFKNCCAGAHYQTVLIDMRKAGADIQSAGTLFLRFRFETVFTTKIDWSGPGDEGPEESLTFVYGKMGVVYVPQAASGELAGNSTLAGWNQVTNRADDGGLNSDPAP
jgi:type VI protein secretion system component Hcp